MSKWDRRMLGLVNLVATWSKDPSTGVGAVIVDAKNRVVSLGYNGFPRAVCDSDEALFDRDEKLRRPSVVFGEQVASKVEPSEAVLVCDDVEGTGYAIAAVDMCAAGVGAPHVRQRIFFVADADPDCFGLETHANESSVCISPVVREVPGRPSEMGSSAIWLGPRPTGARPMALGNGSAAELGRLRAYGNAIVPQVAEQLIASYLKCRP